MAKGSTKITSISQDSPLESGLFLVTELIKTRGSRFEQIGRGLVPLRGRCGACTPLWDAQLHRLSSKHGNVSLRAKQQFTSSLTVAVGPSTPASQRCIVATPWQTTQRKFPLLQYHLCFYFPLVESAQCSVAETTKYSTQYPPFSNVPFKNMGFFWSQT